MLSMDQTVTWLLGNNKSLSESINAYFINYAIAILSTLKNWDSGNNFLPSSELHQHGFHVLDNPRNTSDLHIFFINLKKSTIIHNKQLGEFTHILQKDLEYMQKQYALLKINTFITVQ